MKRILAFWICFLLTDKMMEAVFQQYAEELEAAGEKAGFCAWHPIVKVPTSWKSAILAYHFRSRVSRHTIVTGICDDCANNRFDPANPGHLTPERQEIIEARIRSKAYDRDTVLDTIARRIQKEWRMFG